MIVEKANLVVFLLSLCSACLAEDGDLKPAADETAPTSQFEIEKVACGLDLKPSGRSATFHGRIEAPKGDGIEGTARLYVLGKGKSGIEIEDIRPIRIEPGDRISVAFAALPNANAKVTARLDVLDGKGSVLCSAET